MKFSDKNVRGHLHTVSDLPFLILFQIGSILHNSILLKYCSILHKKHLQAYKETKENSRVNYILKKHRDQGWDLFKDDILKEVLRKYKLHESF